MLREDFIPDYGLTVAGLAEALDVSRQSINELLREWRAVSPEMALRLGRLFGNSPRVLAKRTACNRFMASRSIKEEIAKIKPAEVA